MKYLFLFNSLSVIRKDPTVGSGRVGHRKLSDKVGPAHPIPSVRNFKRVREFTKELAKVFERSWIDKINIYIYGEVSWCDWLSFGVEGRVSTDECEWHLLSPRFKHNQTEPSQNEPFVTNRHFKTPNNRSFQPRNGRICSKPAQNNSL